jgi:hypothetical protein
MPPSVQPAARLHTKTTAQCLLFGTDPEPIDDEIDHGEEQNCEIQDDEFMVGWLCLLFWTDPEAASEAFYL